MVASSQSVLARTPQPTVDHQVEFVVDGGPRLGFGHVGRCLALWEELERRAAFRVRDASVAAFVRARGVTTAATEGAPVVVLDRATPVPREELYALRERGCCTVLLDDLGPARAIADVVIDPPLAAAWPPTAGICLGGFEHVLLRRAVRAAVRRGTPRLGVLLAMGGSDPAGLTPVLAEALSAAGIELTVVIGPGYRGMSPTRGRLLRDPADFASVLADATLLVTGYGHSLLEAAHLGVPAIAVVQRPEHLRHARAFCQAGTACELDMTMDFDPARVVMLVDRLLSERDIRVAMEARGRELIDGHGARRVAEVLKAFT